jgi:hypothetical protein
VTLLMRIPEKKYLSGSIYDHRKKSAMGFNLVCGASR